MFVKHELQRDFVMPLKTNRKVALSLDNKKQGCPYKQLSRTAVNFEYHHLPYNHYLK